MPYKEIELKKYNLNDVFTLNVKSDVFDIVVRLSDKFSIRVDDDNTPYKIFTKKDLPGSLTINEIELSITYELFLKHFKEIKDPDLNLAAIVVEIPRGVDYSLNLETLKSDIYFSDDIHRNHVPKLSTENTFKILTMEKNGKIKIRCKTQKGDIYTLGNVGFIKLTERKIRERN